MRNEETSPNHSVCHENKKSHTVNRGASRRTKQAGLRHFKLQISNCKSEVWDLKSETPSEVRTTGPFPPEVDQPQAEPSRQSGLAPRRL
jgi:hypothetical protein